MRSDIGLHAADVLKRDLPIRNPTGHRHLTGLEPPQIQRAEQLYIGDVAEQPGAKVLESAKPFSEKIMREQLRGRFVTGLADEDRSR